MNETAPLHKFLVLNTRKLLLLTINPVSNKRLTLN